MLSVNLLLLLGALLLTIGTALGRAPLWVPVLLVVLVLLLQILPAR